MNNVVRSELQQTLRHIAEKIDWAERSLASLEVAANQKDATALQDHFWSFLHASQLLWFYVGRYFTSIRNSGGGAKTFVQDWVTNSLDANEQLVWKRINELGTSDVHIQPVVTEEKTERCLLTRDGKLLMRDGKPLVRTRTQYLVSLRGTPRECQKIAKQWIALARRMTEHLKINAPT